MAPMAMNDQAVAATGENRFGAFSAVPRYARAKPRPHLLHDKHVVALLFLISTLTRL